MINPTQSAPTLLTWPRWFTSRVQAVWGTLHQPTQVADVPTVAESKPALLTLQASLPLGQTAVVCLAVAGKLNCHTYLYLIETAHTHYQQGRRGLLLDLCQTSQIELSGLFALLSIARLYSGQSLLEPEAGWTELRRAAETATPALGERVKLLAPSAAVMAALQGASFCRFLAHYADLEGALAAFPLA
jgi:hypothetical protein